MNATTFAFDFLLFNELGTKERKAFAKKCTVADFQHFLANNDEQNYYLLDGTIIQMSNASETHNDIILNFSDYIRSHIRQNNLNCKFHFEMAVEFDHVNKFQPDFSVSCGEHKKTIIVGEVLSKSTYKEDWHKKLPIYKNQPSIGEICYIEQNKKHITLFVRDTINSQQWHEWHFDNNDDCLVFKSIGLTLSLADIYHAVELNKK